MIDMATLTTYIAVVLGFVFIPGPATLLTLARATTSGPKVGIATGAGIAAGDLLHTVMTVVGISAIIAASALLFNIIKYIGATYLIYIGIRAIFDKTSVNLTAKTITISASQAFNQAMLAEVLNPKTALFFFAFLPQFVRPENGSTMLQLIVLGVIFISLGLISTITFALGGSEIGNFLRRHPSIIKWQGKIVGSVYCALGLGIAFQEL